MAELVGVIASGISIAALAAQIANSVAQLKSYWNEVKEAPEDIQILVEEIEALQLLFLDIEEDQRRNPISGMILDTGSLSRCLEHCRHGNERLKELTDDLGGDIRASRRLRKRWASAKVVMQKDKIEKYKSRLERTIRLLSLSHQCYTRALIQLQPDVIVSRITEVINTIQTSNSLSRNPAVTAFVEAPIVAHETIIIDLSGSHRTPLRTSDSPSKDIGGARQRRKKLSEQWIVRYRAPAWFVNWSWDLEASRSRSGWAFKLRSYNTVAWDSAIGNAVSEGNLTRIRVLFDSGKASVNDIIGGRWSLLQLAARKGSLGMCQLLLEQGAEADMTPDGLNPPIEQLIWNGSLRMTIDGKALDTVRLFVDIHDVDLELSMLGGFRGSKDVFQSLQQYTTVPYYESPVEGRALVAMGLARGAQWNSPDLFRIAIQPGPIPRSAIRYNSVERGTLLHGVARALGIVTGSTQVAPYGHSPYIEEGLPGWRALLRELVLGGSDLHAYVFNTCDCSELASTPFIDLLQGAGCTGTSDGNLRCQKCNQLLKIWLEELAACGVDLQEYGEKEKAIHHSIPMVKEFRTSTNRDEYVWHLSSFTFGPSPDDWYLWESEHTDNFVGEFWSIVDPPELIIPGNWID